MIVSIRHSGIYVKNYRESVNFYKKLGMKVVYESIEDWKDSFGTLRVAKLKSKDGSLFEIICPKKQDKYLYSGTHICFEVDHLDKLYRKLRKDNIKFIVKPTIASKLVKKFPKELSDIDDRLKVAFCYDPNNFRLELLERL